MKLIDFLQVYVHTFTDYLRTTVAAEINSINSLVKGLSSLDILSSTDAAPEGCGAYSLSQDCNVYLLVKGRIDADAEISRAEAKLKKTQQSLAKQEKLLGAADFREKVKKEVFEAEEKKLSDLRAEEQTLKDVIEKFQKLKA
jgi:valyl-tRNA synthetase